MKSPNWKDDELKLALELYLSKDLVWLSKMSDKTLEIQLLSRLLNGMDYYTGKKPDNFRSCGSIRMKLSNFKALDERYGKSSLSNVGNLDKSIWKNYYNRYDELKAECGSIVADHFKGIIDQELKEYIQHFGEKNPTDDIPADYLEFVRNTHSFVCEYAENNPEINENVLSSCHRIRQTLEEFLQKIQPVIDATDDTKNYKEHGGVNLVPIDDKEEKVGKHVQQTIQNMISMGLITNEILENLTSAEWSQEVLHLGHPFFKLAKPVKKGEKERDQRLDQNGHLRYWKTKYVVNNQSYFVCKEWYEPGRKYFDKWVTSVQSPLKLNMTVESLENLLEFIKDADLNELSIKREDLFVHMKNVEDKNALLQKLLDIGLLSSFQGTERELVVDDYELLFRMIENPNHYA